VTQKSTNSRPIYHPPTDARLMQKGTVCAVAGMTRRVCHTFSTSCVVLVATINK
jgi:hypothetical protein